jgi:hypothetical protein
MDNIASYNSDVDVLINKINKNNRLLDELGNTEKIELIKNYDGINDEVNKLLYREKIIFGISGFIAVAVTIITFKMI